MPRVQIPFLNHGHPVPEVPRVEIPFLGRARVPYILLAPIGMVLISWNTEGKKNGEEGVSTLVLLYGAISINPLNWRLDDTYAAASGNLGSFMANEETGECKFADVGADAQVDTTRGVVVTNADCAQVPLPEFMGPDSRHDNEYGLYYNNTKDNVAKRIASYLVRSNEVKRAFNH